MALSKPKYTGYPSGIRAQPVGKTDHHLVRTRMATYHKAYNTIGSSGELQRQNPNKTTCPDNISNKEHVAMRTQPEMRQSWPVRQISGAEETSPISPGSTHSTPEHVQMYINTVTILISAI